ncbi:MAG: divalent-cation tolerance protein CutA [Acidobacteriota bacterium]
MAAQTAMLVLTTFPDEETATRATRPLVDERLAACVAILPPMTSLYRWQGAVEQARECQVVIKTTDRAAERVLARLAREHPYETPELLLLPVAGGGEAYLRWLYDSVS